MKIFANYVLLLAQNIIYDDNEDITEKKEVEKTGFSSEQSKFFLAHSELQS